jgi:hypothetical protein
LPLPSECANPTDVLAQNVKRTAVVYQYLEGCVQSLEGCELTVCPRPLVVATACCTCALQEAKRGSDVERLETFCKVSALVYSLWKITVTGTFQIFVCAWTCGREFADFFYAIDTGDTLSCFAVEVTQYFYFACGELEFVDRAIM